MRSMRLVGTMLALILIASACGGDDESSDPEDPTPTTPTTARHHPEHDAGHRHAYVSPGHASGSGCA